MSKARRRPHWKKISIPVGIVFVALTIAAGIWLWSEKHDSDSQSPMAEASRVLPKAWLAKYFQTEDENAPQVGGGQGDPDDDILTNFQEYLYGTDPTREDTDGDGEIDSYEVAFGQNPNGENALVPTREAQDYLKEVIEGSEQFSQFSEANIAAEVNGVLKTDQAVVLDFPADSELVIVSQNDPTAFEKYFEETKGLMTAPDQDFQNIETRLFDGMSDAEIDSYIEQLLATEKVLKNVAVPSEIVNIQKLKIAGLRAGVKMFELVRDRYSPETESPEFWAELFNKMVAIQTANTMEIAAWDNLGTYLKDTGGWEEIEDGK